MSALALVLAPFLILVSIWLYTLVFAFSSLWFAHYLLARRRCSGFALDDVQRDADRTGPAADIVAPHDPSPPPGVAA